MALAWREWRSVGITPPREEPDPPMQVRFLSALGLGVSSLMALATLVLWAVVLIVPPCVR